MTEPQKKRYGIFLPVELMEQVQAEARRDHRKICAVIEIALREHLERKEGSGHENS